MTIETEARQNREELRLLRPQVEIYRERMRSARCLIDDAEAALEHTILSVASEDVKRNVNLFLHLLRRWKQRDDRFANLDNSN